ncbi:hypothetical protein SmJEL517_g03285 [Synchytrium microbalum]|uniref:RNA helicase n=1 Tax=Synchytrium microbalum TaxID=1806994 RepID=A0A507C778_9FUNG|nr:uncharacterized protein SmJEL517_g03285 [Synchytrium microbalum]TPX33846.1 hypothetical protein SmJEL517_g03285 [Synchytrium microbalum]
MFDPVAFVPTLEDDDEPATLKPDAMAILHTKPKRKLPLTTTTNVKPSKKKARVDEDADSQDSNDTAIDPSFQFDADGGDVTTSLANWNFNSVLDWAKGTSRSGFTSVEEKIASFKLQGLGPKMSMIQDREDDDEKQQVKKSDEPELGQNDDEGTDREGIEIEAEEEDGDVDMEDAEDMEDVEEASSVSGDDDSENDEEEISEEEDDEEEGEDEPMTNKPIDLEALKQNLDLDDLEADDIELSDTVLQKKKAEFFAPAPDAPAIGSFADMKLSRPVLKAITAAGYTTPTPIQSNAIPVGLRGRDICAAAVTGSGKTAAFLIPIIERLSYRPRNPPTTRVLILVPTRELGVQCHGSLTALTRFTDITSALCVGGLDVRRQEAELRKAPDVVVATPGRLIDHLRNARGWGVEHVEILVMDEADRMLDAGFQEELAQIISSTPRNRQTMLFSATMTDNVDQLVSLTLKEPVRLFINSTESIASRLTQEFVRIKEDRDRLPVLMALCKRTFKEQVLIFVKSKALAHRIRILFGVVGMRAGELHGDLNQAQRLEALSAFKSADTPYLIATDLASRGLDVPGIKTVINMSLPATYAQYIHRVGRTARASDSGTAVSLVLESDRSMVKLALKNATSNVSYRTVKRVVIQKFKSLIDAAKELIEKVIEQEGFEKQMNEAEMEVMKASNMIDHRDEILGRPARSWFQSGLDKSKARESSKNAPISAIPASQKDDNSISTTQPKREKTRRERRKMEALNDGANPKAQKFAVRAAKKAAMPKKIGAIAPKSVGKSGPKKPQQNKNKSSFGARGFATELSDTSGRGAGAKYKSKSSSSFKKGGSKDFKGGKADFGGSGGKKGSFSKGGNKGGKFKSKGGSKKGRR